MSLRPSADTSDAEQHWIDIDHYSLTHLHPPSRPNIEALNKALDVSDENDLPSIQIAPSYGKFLALQCRLTGAKHALELGTLGGYSAIWLATENPNLHVSTVEFNRKHAQVARQNIKKAGVEDRVTVYQGPGTEVVPKLLAEIEAGKLERIGFTFIDADKLNNWTYFDLAVKMSVPGAAIVIDNMSGNGRLHDEKYDSVHARGGRKAVEEIGKDDRVDGVLLQTVGSKGYDGFLMAVVK